MTMLEVKSRPIAGPIPFLAAAIGAARQKRGLTQEELAARVGVSQGTISFWENGVERPAFRNLLKLALELPELIPAIEGQESAVMERLRWLERAARHGRCDCPGCTCSPR
jgi:transcriptional regulator with XRE-family HTH domain